MVKRLIRPPNPRTPEEGGICPCESKSGKSKALFRTMHDAYAFMQYNSAVGQTSYQRVYECPYRMGWHLSSVKSDPSGTPTQPAQPSPNSKSADSGKGTREVICPECGRTSQVNHLICVDHRKVLRCPYCRLILFR